MVFKFICIISMWLMIFAVGIMYVSILPKKNRESIFLRFILSILLSIVIWILVGNNIAFSGNHPLFGNVQNPFGEGTILSLDEQSIIEMLFQLCFMLYAVVMLIGSVIDRIKIRSLVLIVISWIIIVYAPLAHWFWHSNGWLYQMGVLDFSGGMVVHLSAGISAYVLASFIPKENGNLSNDPPQYNWLFLSVILICFGWFGFNAGPVGELNKQTAIILVNTFIAIVSGGFSWYLLDKWMNNNQSLIAMLNGMVCGLVTSTAGVGSITPIAEFILTFISAGIAYYSIEKILPRYAIDDVVDSFGMNGIGGAMGAFFIGIFVNRQVNPEIKNVTILHLIGIQSLGIIATSVYSFVMTYLICKLFVRKSCIK